ncbi:MAG: DNA-3-methyladenine glycosylase 2 family protein, partial [Patescibacteria group bacterium]
MDQRIIDHFKKADPVLYAYIEKVELAVHRKNDNLFASLCDEIISQQLSGKAAGTIFDRFKKLFNNEDITPEALIKIPDEKIREAGT